LQIKLLKFYNEFFNLKNLKNGNLNLINKSLIKLNDFFKDDDLKKLYKKYDKSFIKINDSKKIKKKSKRFIKNLSKVGMLAYNFNFNVLKFIVNKLFVIRILDLLNYLMSGVLKAFDLNNFKNGIKLQK
jgi:hypothetical protein